MDIKTQKTRARLQAKQRRAEAHSGLGAVQLLEHVPADVFRGRVIGGYWPLTGELDVRPLLNACHAQGHELALPCTPRKGKPLVFRAWTPEVFACGIAYAAQEAASLPVDEFDYPLDGVLTDKYFKAF